MMQTVSIDGPSTRFRRDELGESPIYYRIVGAQVFVSSSLGDIVRAKRDGLSLNLDFFQSLLWDFFADQEATGFKEVKRVPPGATLEVGGGRWRVVSAPLADSLLAVARDLPLSQLSESVLLETLFNSLRLRVAGRKHVCVFLSGGLDSSLILSLLAELRKECDFVLHALSVDFTSGEESNSGPLAEVLSRIPCPSRVLRESDMPVEAFDLPKVDMNSGYYFYTPGLALYRPLFSEVDHRGAIVMTGLGGDDLFSLRLLGKSGWLRSITPAQAARIFRKMRGAQAPEALINLEAGRENRLRQEIEHWRDRAYRIGGSPHQKELIARAALGGRFSFALEQEQELARERGHENAVAMSHPLTSWPLIQHLVRYQRSAWPQNHDDKPFLRALASTRLPESVARRRSQQNYNSWAQSVWARQSNEMSVRLHWLVSRGLIRKVQRSLTMDECAVLNYLYSLCHRGGINV